MRAAQCALIARERHGTLAVVRVLSVDASLRDELPHGLGTEVGKRGSRLSGGQQQCVSPMRALFARPRLVILDEPTSALDGETEERVCRGLVAAREHSTILLFSHRLSTVKVADHVVVLRDDRVVETGTPAALLRQRGEFYRLFASQLQEERE
ncbi:MAG: ATP-binding cassette domain-containing protein [Bacillota bacterium]